MEKRSTLLLKGRQEIYVYTKLSTQTLEKFVDRFIC